MRTSAFVVFPDICRGVVRLWCCIFSGSKRPGWSSQPLKYIFTCCTQFTMWVVYVDVGSCFSKHCTAQLCIFVCFVCSGRNTGLFWRITACDTTRTLLRRRRVYWFSSQCFDVEQLFLFARWSLCFLRLLTWMVRLTCQPAAMWRSTRHSATMASKYM